MIRSADDSGGALVHIVDYCGTEANFEVTLPLVFIGQLRDCSIDVSGNVELVEHTSEPSGSVFRVRGKTSIICEHVEIKTSAISLDGKIWLEADQVVAPGRFEVDLRNGTEVGWGGDFATSHPWREFPPTLDAPYPIEGDPLTNLVEECWQRLSSAGVLTLTTDFAVPVDDHLMAWAQRHFRESFPALIRLMVKHGLASADPTPASGTRKVRVHFEVTWQEIRDALQGNAVAPRLSGFLEEARGIFAAN